ncbi:MAG TPA: hypothetical protein VES20_11465, partial [Bryobacteraceae bacterium]|nr:hypothetical protein [Bryobacteraceae bacterium]
MIREQLDDIRYGQIEAGILDAIFPECDGVNTLSGKLRRIAIDRNYESLVELNLPEQIRVRPQEGFAYYALYPDQYARAARRFKREQQPSRCTVIGIRSIGTTLAAEVVRALGCACESWTVRPHGHPFDRRVCLHPDLQVRVGDWHLVVDEGPGISGSSFAAVADALNERGVPDERIVFFPSYEPDREALCSERARARWYRHRIYVEPFDEAGLIPSGARDLSGGAWREVVGLDVPVQPSHERRKYLHEGRLLKFAGLGRYGESKLRRAHALVRFVPQAEKLENGFLVTSWVPGVPAAIVDPGLLWSMA